MFSDTNKLFFNTTPINRLKATKAMRELYQYCNTHSYASECWKGYTTARPSREPDIIFADGPDELVDLFNVDDTELVDLERFNDIAHFVSKRGYGSKERVSSVISQIFARLLPYKRTPRCWASPLFMPVDYLYNNEHKGYANQWEDLATKVWDEIYVAFTYKDRCYIIDRPSLVNANDRGLHCKDGPAMVFRDGSEIYCYEGIKVSEGAIKHPERMTLKDIHQHNSRKHILIDLCGVDRYLEMCKAWKPDVKGKFAKFFSMAQMKPEPGSWSLREYGKDWKGYGDSYKERPAYVDIFHRDVNGQSVLSLEDNWYNIYAFGRDKHPFDNDFASAIFNKQDRELWDLFDVEEMLHRGAHMGVRVAFQNGVFSLKNDKEYHENFRVCRHDIAPAWFKAKMFRKQNALYINEELDYAIKYEDGKLSYAGNVEQGNSCIPSNEPRKPIIARNSLFSGCENIPSYQFDIDLTSDTWEGLLGKWAHLSFEWLGMCENSTCLP